MIIGLTGSFGAGKGAVVDYLVKEKGFKHFSARFLIREVIEDEGSVVNRDSLIEMGNRLRKEHGPDYIARTLFKRAEEMGGNAVIESLRATAEVYSIKESGGVVIGVDADPNLRYERAVSRGSETDDVTFEKWKEQQKIETNPDDPTKQDVYKALAESDYIVMNDGTLEELHTKIDRVLEKIS